MRILAVIIDILKIIGILLLGIVTVLLTVILLVLLCPWRYCVDVKKEKKLTGKAVVSWLLHILRVEVIYLEAVNIRIRVFGIPVYDKLKREARVAAKAEKAAAKKQRKSRGSDQNSAQNKEDTAPDLQDSGGEKPAPRPDITAASVEQKENPQDGHPRDKKSRRKTGKVWWEFPQYFFELLMGWGQRLLEMILFLPELVGGPMERLEKKIVSAAARVEYYIKLLQKKGSKWVIDFLKVRIFKVLKHIRPRNSRIDLYYAAEDPAKVADMMAYYGMALPFLPKHTNFTAELGAPKLEGSVKIKGRVCLIVLLWHGLSIYLNKKVKTFLKLLKEGQKI